MLRDIKALDAYLTALCEKKGLTGIAVAALGPAGETFIRGYGQANGDGTHMVDGDTLFGIASMSKSHVTLSCAILEMEGKLSFEDPVHWHFPNFKIPGAARDAITLRHLAMHTAGIPPMETLEWSIAMHMGPERLNDWAKKLRETAPNPMATIDQIIDYIATCPYPSLGAPGEVMSYCNEGYALLSYVVDQAAGMPLEQFLMERVYGPLSMTRTVLDVDASEARRIAGGNITSLCAKDGEGNTTWDDEWSVLPPFRGCGLVKSTARDMATYYRCLASGGVHEGRQVIPKAAIERMVGKAFPAQKTPGYCLGLYKRAYGDHVICEHGGALHGVSSHGGLLLGEGWGFAALCNLDDQDVDAFTWAMYNWAMGHPLGSSHRWYRDAGRDFTNPEMIEGTYRGHEGIPSDVMVFQREGKLIAQRDEKQMLMAYCGGTLFVAFDEAGEPILRMEAFIRDGKAWGLRCGSRVFQRISE